MEVKSKDRLPVFLQRNLKKGVSVKEYTNKLVIKVIDSNYKMSFQPDTEDYYHSIGKTQLNERSEEENFISQLKNATL